MTKKIIKYSCFLLFFIIFGCNNYKKIQKNEDEEKRLQSFYISMFERYGVNFRYKTGELTKQYPRLNISFSHHSVPSLQNAEKLLISIRNELMETFHIDNIDVFTISIEFDYGRPHDILYASCLGNDFSICTGNLERRETITYKDFFAKPSNSPDECEKIVEIL